METRSSCAFLPEMVLRPDYYSNFRKRYANRARLQEFQCRPTAAEEIRRGGELALNSGPYQSFECSSYVFPSPTERCRVKMAESSGDSSTHHDDHARRQSVAIVRKYLHRTLCGDRGRECTSRQAADARVKLN
jgi:hypothetical protein